MTPEQHATVLKALKEAAASLETISRLAGKTHCVDETGERVDTYMGHHDQVRGYAASRASVAREAIAIMEHPGMLPKQTYGTSDIEAKVQELMQIALSYATHFNTFQENNQRVALECAIREALGLL